jgi:dihydrofolate reductase
MRRAAMGKATSEISMSLDGFITDPDASVGTPLEGDDPGRLSDWQFDAKTETDAAIVDEMFESTGAVLMWKRMFDVGFEPWGDPPPYGMPVFIVTHEEREPLPMQGVRPTPSRRVGSRLHSSWPVPPPATRASVSGAERTS